MRVATLFKRVLRLGRGRVVGFELVEEDGAEQVVVEVALTERRVMRCSGCAMRVRTAYDTRQVSWRHLDLGRIRCLIRCQVRRVECPACGVRNESVPWARSGSRFTRAFEDTCVWLVKAAPKSTVATLMLSRVAHGGPDDRAGRHRAQRTTNRRWSGWPCPHRDL